MQLYSPHEANVAEAWHFIEEQHTLAPRCREREPSTSSVITSEADIERRPFHFRFGPILLQKDFWPRSEERFFQIERERGIMIQESGCLDSIIAHFCPSGRQAETFATVSVISGHFVKLGRCPLPPSRQ
jgi:hypothetical protein